MPTMRLCVVEKSKDFDCSVHNEGTSRAGHVTGVTSMSRGTRNHNAPSGRSCRKPVISQPLIMKSLVKVEDCEEFDALRKKEVDLTADGGHDKPAASGDQNVTCPTAALGSTEMLAAK